MADADLTAGLNLSAELQELAAQLSADAQWLVAQHPLRSPAPASAKMPAPLELAVRNASGRNGSHGGRQRRISAATWVSLAAAAVVLAAGVGSLVAWQTNQRAAVSPQQVAERTTQSDADHLGLKNSPANRANELAAPPAAAELAQGNSAGASEPSPNAPSPARWDLTRKGVAGAAGRMSPSLFQDLTEPEREAALDLMEDEGQPASLSI